MLYSYKCPECGWTGDRVCKIAERDSQWCLHLQDFIKEDGGAVQMPCQSELIREEISTTAKLADQWSEWRRR